MTSTRRIMASEQKRFRLAFRALTRDVANQVNGMVLAAADGRDEPILPAKADKLSADAGYAFQRVFVGVDGRSAFGRDGVSALSPYAAELNRSLVMVTGQAVYAQRDWMQRNVPRDVYNWLASVPSKPLRETTNPFLRGANETRDQHIERLKILRIFDPNPLATYEAPHTWVDPKGYTLSRRIWNTSQESRRKLDEMVADMITQGKSSLQIARAVEQFLIEGRAKFRTNRPYGTDVSYDAMRLARTEIAHAANQAALIAALRNPYVETIDIVRSANGDVTCTICPQHATIGMGGERLREAYPVGQARTGPFHPHCVTPGQFVQTARGNVPIETIIPGDYVVTHTGEYHEVIDAWNRPYEGWVYEIETNAGSFELTSEHPVLSAADNWVDAQFIQPGQQVVYATVNVGFDSILFVPKGQPTESSEISISPSILFGLVPSSTVAFNRNSTFFNARQTVGEEMFIGIREQAPTYGAMRSQLHDNLLSSSPECQVGAASGNAVVEQVANLPQAHVYYTTVRNVKRRWYRGLVYNMHVAHDNSYTVNGAAVHNCMCHARANVSQTPGQVTDALRAMMQEVDLTPALTPVQADVFIEQLLGQTLMNLLGQVAQLPLF